MTSAATAAVRPSRIHPLPLVEYLPLSEIEESRDVALIYSAAAWAAAEPSLRINPVWRAEPVLAEIAHWDEIGRGLRGDVIYSVGGGLAVDAAKFLSARSGLPLVCIPTAVSVDAFFTWASGYRADGCVRYIETRPPDRLYFDTALIADAPESVRAAGICDLLSIATGNFDWKYADERGLNPPHAPFVGWVSRQADAILEGAIDCAEAAGRADPEGLKCMNDALALEVQLCNQIGHSRPEEGSEHYFAYSVENETGKGLPHGDLVGPGILTMARLQGLDTAPLEKALRDCRVPLRSIPAEVIRRTLASLPGYCRRHALPHGLAHDLTPEMLKGF